MLSALTRDLFLMLLDVSCPTPTGIPNGFITFAVMRRHGYKDRVRYGCNDHYVLDGEAEIQCRNTGNWSSKPVCRGESWEHQPTLVALFLYIFPGILIIRLDLSRCVSWSWHMSGIGFLSHSSMHRRHQKRPHLLQRQEAVDRRSETQQSSPWRTCCVLLHEQSWQVWLPCGQYL